ncbi:MAG: DUF4129 domain-containing protein [Ferruginibacter sp.]|nr:DUF4129 domain-containing protein [Ferruginibacter sp.]
MHRWLSIIFAPSIDLAIVSRSIPRALRNSLLPKQFAGFFLTCCLLGGFLTNTAAQTSGGYVYIDSSLLGEPKKDNADAIGEKNFLTDTTLYTHVINISADTLIAWKKDSRYSYIRNLDSLLKLKEQELKDDEKERNGPGNGYGSTPKDKAPSFAENLLSSNILSTILWAFAVSLVLFILYKLFLNQGIFQRKVTELPVKGLVEDEPIPADVSDYDKLIQQSFKLSDYRMAVRYLFLKTLWKLCDKGLLERSVDKTNFQYVREIAPAKKNEFAALVLKYEYIWYGRFIISREQYAEVEKDYTTFYNKI